MNAQVEKIHSKSNDYVIKDIELADFGRKEIKNGRA
jgi:hypothetical protein